MSKSLVWHYFVVGRADDGWKIGTCRLCDSDQPPTFRCSLNSTSSLWSHLQSKHQTEHDSLFRKKQIAILKKSATVIKQPIITAMFASNVPYGQGHHKQKQFDKNMNKLFVNECVPFNLANSPHFRKLVSDLDPKIKVQTRQTYSKNIRQNEKKVKTSIKRLIRSMNVRGEGLVGLTADMWDDRKQNSFCSLTAHFVDKISI